MHWSKTVDDSDHTPMALLVTLPADLLLTIFVPDATRLAICVEHASIRTMINFSEASIKLRNFRPPLKEHS